jgi:hypothetical protein
MGRNFGGPNGLGANSYIYDESTRTLTFNYVEPGRPRVDNMLFGTVTESSPREFALTIIGEYYGQNASGFSFKFKRLAP